MYKERISELADYIERSEGFNQTSSALNGCGCVASKAIELFSDQGMPRRFPSQYEEREFAHHAMTSDLCNFLGVGYKDAIRIFSSKKFEGGGFPKKADAVAMLRHLAETGKVDWNINETTAEVQK